MSSARAVAICPAKVNLALHVLDRRADGNHELDTLFQAIDLWDRIEIRPDPVLRMTCDDPTLPTDGTNLVLRAARLVQQVVGSAAGARLHLSKTIPAGGGLGGGSSDAAGALLLCARFWNVTFDPAELWEMARGLGADVPFFLTGGTARGRGRGDLVEPMAFVGKLEMVLGLPPFGVSTREVFSGVGAKLTLPRNGVSLPRTSAHKWPRDNDFGFAVNDLERVVFVRWPELRRFRDALLEAGARGALLSGSGSTVYGIFGGSDRLEEIVGGLKDRFPTWRILPTRAVNEGAQIVAPDTTRGGR